MINIEKDSIGIDSCHDRASISFTTSDCILHSVSAEAIPILFLLAQERLLQLEDDFHHKYPGDPEIQAYRDAISLADERTSTRPL